MNNKYIKAIILPILFLGIGLLILNLIIEQDSWNQIAEKNSPDGKFTLYEYSYYSDTNRHAPYGTYIFLKPEASNRKPINSHVIFAGYCVNKNISEWVSNDQIDISCLAKAKDSIRTQSSEAYGIKTNINLMQEKQISTK